VLDSVKLKFHADRGDGSRRSGGNSGRGVHVDDSNRERLKASFRIGSDDGQAFMFHTGTGYIILLEGALSGTTGRR